MIFYYATPDTRHQQKKPKQERAERKKSPPEETVKNIDVDQTGQFQDFR